MFLFSITRVAAGTKTKKSHTKSRMGTHSESTDPPRFSREAILGRDLCHRWYTSHRPSASHRITTALQDGHGLCSQAVFIPLVCFKPEKSSAVATELVQLLLQQPSFLALGRLTSRPRSSSKKGTKLAVLLTKRRERPRELIDARQNF